MIWFSQSASTSGLGTGSCDNGLGFPEQPVTPSPPPPYGVGGNSGGPVATKYEVLQNPGASFPESLSPTANVSGTGSVGLPAVTGSGYVAPNNIGIDVYPIGITLSGGIGTQAAHRYLVGQHCSAGLNVPFGCSPKNFKWGVSGGKPFKDYVASTASGTYTGFDSSKETGTALDVWFADHTGTATVSCQFDLTLPANSKPNAGLTGLSATKKLGVDRPDWDISTVVCGTVTPQPDNINPLGVALKQATLAHPKRGIDWSQVTVTTPAKYGSGIWNWTQLVVPGRKFKDGTGYKYIALSNYNPPKKVYGVQCLDNSYPYGRIDGGSGNWYVADGTPGGDFDAPFQSFSGPGIEWDISDTFDDYLMFEPLDVDSKAVPLKTGNWYWNATGTYNLLGFNTWAVTGTDAKWTEGQQSPAHPEWTFPLYNSSANVYVP